MTRLHLTNESVDHVSNSLKGGFFMIYVGIDIAKDKHDCCLISSDGEMLEDHFTFSNNLNGFNSFLSLLKSFNSSKKR